MSNIASIFGEYATGKALQLIIDKRMDKFKTREFSKYLSWDTPQVDLSFKDVIGKTKLDTIASVVGEDSVSPVRSRSGLSKFEGSIPTISHKYIMKNSDYRAYVSLQNMSNINDDTKKKQIIDLIFNDIQFAANGCTGRLDVMFLQALSTGIIDLSATGNPDGVAYGEIPVGLPTENVINTSEDWTDPTATPLEDFEAVIDAAQSKGNDVFEKMIMTRATFNKLKNSAQIQNVFKNTVGRVPVLVTQDNLNEYLKSNGLPVIELQTSLFNIEEDGVTSSFRAFADDVIVFVPQGELGKVKNALVTEGDLTQVSGHTYANVDKVKIAKWSTTEPLNEFTRGQLLAIPSITAIDAVYHLKLTGGSAGRMSLNSFDLQSNDIEDEGESQEEAGTEEVTVETAAKTAKK
ncbi:major capsid protein [Chryseobacterium indologenes]|uniref:major capsid protein n=1 Tax=Chryseobacterium indologenes TaxID=253 RepID=UPI0009A1A9FB|nr:major capsid protein [Chryseobacterium indologenes]